VDEFDQLDHIAPQMPILTLMWLETKDFNLVASYFKSHQQGIFVKGMLRLVNMMDQLKRACLELEDLELFNKLHNYKDLLLEGIVSNESLYVRLHL
jgi:ATP-dependent helicase/DNAse subunit B